jgi:ComF family protein
MFRAAAAPVNEMPLVMSTIGEFLTRLVFPPACCMCGWAAADLDLCDVCAGLLPPDAGGHAPPIFTRVLAPFQYAYPVDHFIRALKFRGERVYARVLGSLLAREHARRGWRLPEALIPVPLHRERHRERGFNQACEIARFAGTMLHVPVDTSCLTRLTPTHEQSGLTLTARRRNVRRAFRASRSTARTHVALVDDVITTGSTAAEAARALADVNDFEIELWVAARVPTRKAAAGARVQRERAVARAFHPTASPRA